MLWLAFRKRMSFLNATLVVVFISLALNIYLTSKNQAAALYLPFGRFWELAAGGLLAAAHRASTPLDLSPLPGTRNALSWGGVLLLAVVLATPLDAKMFPGYYVIVVVLAAVLLIAGGQQCRAS